MNSERGNVSSADISCSTESGRLPSTLPGQTGNAKPVESRRPGQSAPPYHPGLHRLVEGKQAWAEPLSPAAKAQGFLGWHQRGYLPHYDVPGVTQFVTFHLGDALPASQRSEWKALVEIESLRERRKQLESYLDRGLGACWLRQPAIASLAEGALRFFDGQRYQLRAWVIMANHVHAVVDVWDIPLARITHSWKTFIAREANKLLGRDGPFWEHEYWDTLMEDDKQLARAVRYTEENPLKARLAREAREWPWSSARFRDAYDRLCLPEVESGAPVSNRL